MAKSRKSHSPATREGAGAGDTDYTVGYGKPPKSGQFKKGESGNGGGGSAKVRARKAEASGSDHDHLLLQEAKRMIPVIEKGVRSEITTDEAVLRQLAMSAVKGDRASQREYLDRTERARERLRKDRSTRFGLLVQYVQEQSIARALGSTPTGSPVWPDPDDIQLDYVDCIGEVVGPIDVQQAEPFIALVAQYRLWHARLAQLQVMAGQAAGDIQASYKIAIGTLTDLLRALRVPLPPSSLKQLDRQEQEVPADVMEFDDLQGGTINLDIMPPMGSDTQYAVHVVDAWAANALKNLRRPTKLNIVANTKSLVNRLQTERANRDGGAPPPLAAPEFGDYYEELIAEPDDNTGSPAQ